MKLTASCNSCKKEHLIKSYASTRPDLAQDKGEEFSMNCTDCGNNTRVHVNEVQAKPNTTVLLAALVVGVLVTVILLYFLGAIGTISLGIPLLMWRQENKSASTFNGYMIRR